MSFMAFIFAFTMSLMVVPSSLMTFMSFDALHGPHLRLPVAILVVLLLVELLEVVSNIGDDALAERLGDVTKESGYGVKVLQLLLGRAVDGALLEEKAASNGEALEVATGVCADKA